MIGTIIGLLFLLIIAGFIVWAIQQLIALVPLGEPFATGVRILMYFIVLVVVLYCGLLGMAGVHVNTFGVGTV
jgi:hypothetical protein